MSVLAAKALVITALAIAPGESLSIRGAVTIRHDGAVLEPAALVDAAAGGLRVVSRTADEVRLEPEPGAIGPACAASGLSSPCLVPRLAEHAHARLLDVDALRASLDGALEIEVVPAPPPKPPSPSRAPWFALAALVLAATLVGRSMRARRSPLFDVIAAATVARRATAHDPTLDVLRLEIERLVEEARALDRQRASAEAVLARQTKTRGARTPEELATDAELRDRIARARSRLAEIASALRIVPSRLVTLDARAGQGAVARVVSELAVRDRALAEADALSSRDAAC